MLKKLRSQFILSNMIMVGMVILGLFSALTIITYNYEASQSKAVLKMALNGDLDLFMFSSENVLLFGEPSSEKNFPDADVEREKRRGDGTNEKMNTIVLFALTDNDGNVIVSDIADGKSYTAEEVKSIVTHAMTSDNKVGLIPTKHMRYMKEPNEYGGYKIVFADRTSEEETLRFMVRLYGVSSLFILSIMFLISDYMAHRAVTPVEKSWKKQNRFVADASHELKTPLTVILANMDIMSLNPDSTVEEQMKWIENTKSEAKRMTQLVNDMLFLAKSDAAVEQGYNFMNTNLSSLAEDCVLTFESVAFEKGVYLRSVVPEDIYVTMDEAKIKQVIMILLDNAIKYVDDNGTIFLTLAQNGKQAKLLVANTGPAIPKEKQKHIFERFFRADDSRARDRGGYGLGLSIAGNIISAHKGKLSLEYSNEKGTCFSIVLPCKGSGTARKGK